MGRTWILGLGFVAAIGARAAVAAAQEPDAVAVLETADLPYDAARDLRAFLRDPTTRTFAGSLRFGAGERLPGGVAVVDGSATVAGDIAGDLVVLRGDLILEPTARVEGDVSVVCGTVRGEGRAGIAGTLTVYDAGFCGRPVYGTPTDDGPPRRRRWGDDRFAGRATVTVRAGQGYNRVEGLPVEVGPVIETQGANPLRIEALAVWRTESDFDTDELGYSILAEQFLGGRRAFRIGGRLFSRVEAIERQGLRDLEASLSTALFHFDPRDYYEREGWGLLVGWAPEDGPVAATIEYRDESHEALAAADPWSLFDGDDAWRPQPLIAEGHLRSLRGELRLDTRDDEDDPTQGWLAAVEWRSGLDGSLEIPAANFIGLPGSDPLDGPLALGPTPVATDFSTARVDLRRYERVGYGSVLALRLAGGGAVTDQPLPPQFQHAIGGIGSLPGHDDFAGDCGARRFGTVPDAGEPRFFRAYGCDRFLLFQAEVIGGLGIDFDFFDRDRPDPDDRDWWYWSVDFDATWSAFFDAGRGWVAADDRFRTGTDWLYDAGVGIRFGDLGIYLATPVGAERRDLNVFLRLGRRF